MKQISILTFALLFSVAGFSQEKDIDLIEMVQDLQQLTKTEQSMKMVWWIPALYWEVALQDKPQIPEEAVEDLITNLEDYHIFAAFHADIGIFGMNYKDSLNVSFIDSDGNTYAPISEDKLSDETINVINTLKPTLANMIGKLGEEMQYFVFPSKNKKGKYIADPLNEGNFKVALDGEDFKWRLPLASVVPKKICPTDQEEMNGAWKYCPWHGKELSAQKK